MRSTVILRVNGKINDYPAEVRTVADLLDLEEWRGRQVIVEHNGEVIARVNWGEARLGERDVLELVYFVGGG